MKKLEFRLIKDSVIVGYERWNQETQLWEYSPDSVRWFFYLIPHDKKQLYTGLKDIRGFKLYEGDSVVGSRHPMPVVKTIYHKSGAFVLCNSKSSGFKLNHVLCSEKVFNEKLLKIN